MNPLRYWKIILSLAFVFAAGAVSGSLATHHLLKRSFERAMNFEHWKTGTMRVLQHKLELTPSQHQAVEQLVDQRGREIRGTFAKAFTDSGHILVQLQHQMDQQLTPSQKEIHERMKREFRSDLKRRFNYDLPAD